MLTSNQKKVLRVILTAFGKDYSINNIANECGLSPNGAYKILKKFEKEGILVHKEIANLKSYKINFENAKSELILELALIADLTKKIQSRSEDLKNLQKITKACILFGSYLTKSDPKDLDILFILEKSNYKDYSYELEKAKEIIPLPVHDIVQTSEDVRQNLVKGDKVLINIFRTGTVIWGEREIIRVIKNVY